MTCKAQLETGALKKNLNRPTSAIMTVSDRIPPFAADVLQGLSQQPKRLPSKYFYDAEGSRIFQAIMNMPEYYLTDCELEIFQQQQDAILQAIGWERFQVLELGPGDGAKTKVLLRHFLESGRDFRYRPIDISGSALEGLAASWRADLPQLEVAPLQGDYFRVLHELRGQADVPKLVLLLGANIGNYDQHRAQQFLAAVAAELAPGDLLLVGFDLKKDPAIILKAYNDPTGITAAFNLNLLARINRELEGAFELEQFCHWQTYTPTTGETRSYLVSLSPQEVPIGALGRSFRFDAWEAIEVELSLKYSLPEIEGLASGSGYVPVEHFLDRRQYFVDSLWRVAG
jgi:L-histidine Nalpha-methyltransferase